jgi:hypothetical protein
MILLDVLVHPRGDPLCPLNVNTLYALQVKLNYIKVEHFGCLKAHLNNFQIFNNS